MTVHFQDDTVILFSLHLQHDDTFLNVTTQVEGPDVLNALIYRNLDNQNDIGRNHMHSSQ